MASTYIALLRGINVGGKNSLPMRELAAIFEDAGCSDVRTYIQSGNVVFAAGAAVAKRIPQLIPKVIEKEFGFSSPVIVRAAKELDNVIARNPFKGKEEKLHVAFLADEPSRTLAAGLDPKRSPGDSFVLKGREVYLHLPNGVARTKLTNAYFDRALKTTSTVRNWKTVMKLVEMANGK